MLVYEHRFNIAQLKYHKCTCKISGWFFHKYHDIKTVFIPPHTKSISLSLVLCLVRSHANYDIVPFYTEYANDIPRVIFSECSYWNGKSILILINNVTFCETSDFWIGVHHIEYLLQPLNLDGFDYSLKNLCFGV